jgi:hypothetical protein
MPHASPIDRPTAPFARLRRGLVALAALAVCAGLAAIGAGGCKTNGDMGNSTTSVSCTETNAPCPAGTIPSGVSVCPAGAKCVSAGACTYECKPSCGSAGQTQCAGTSLVQRCGVDGAWETTEDCSLKGNVCKVAGGAAGCETCPTGQTRCADEQCHDLTKDAANCGSCQNHCTTSDANGSSVCVNSQCKLECDPTFDLCDGVCVESLATNSDHCGACDRKCTTENGKGTNHCVAGKCEPKCASPWGNCDGNDENGCETNLHTTIDACGACGNDCASQPHVVGGGVSCTGGSCTIAANGCMPDFADCDHDGSNGCETNLPTDLRSCGACGNDCTKLPHADQAGVTCEQGVCVIKSCADAGFGVCVEGGKTVCENLAADVANCGACGNVCTNAHGTTSCVGAACKPICDAQHLDCDGAPGNGCELDVTTDANCGACGAACQSPTKCLPKAPSYACATCEDRGLVTCGKGLQAACKDTSTDAANCGACDQSCVNGTCGAGACTKCDDILAAPWTLGPQWATPAKFSCQHMKPGAKATVTCTGHVSIPVPGIVYACWDVIDSSGKYLQPHVDSDCIYLSQQAADITRSFVVTVPADGIVGAVAQAESGSSQGSNITTELAAQAHCVFTSP